MICGVLKEGTGGIKWSVSTFRGDQRIDHDFAFLIIVLIIVFFRVGVKVCITSACLHLWRYLLLVPMLLLQSGILSTWWSINTPFLFFDVLQLLQLHTLLVLLEVQVGVSCNFLHAFLFQCKVSVVLHETHCGFSILVGVWVDTLLVPWSPWFQMVLLILASSSYGMTSSYVSLRSLLWVA